MRIEKFNTYDEMSEFIADIFAAQILLKPDSVLGLATGSTPIGTYNSLIKMYKNGKVDFSKCVTFNLDEYFPISPENEQSYKFFMNENLFNHININKENTHFLNGLAKDAEKECADFEQRITEKGPIDLQLLGIGENGHIAFNEPGEKLYNYTHLTDLTQSTIDANARFFDSIDKVPKQALSMGIGSILRAKKIVIAISGAKKISAFEKLAEGMIDTSSPATLLNLHSDVVVAFCGN